MYIVLPDEVLTNCINMYIDQKIFDSFSNNMKNNFHNTSNILNNVENLKP